MNKKAIIAYSFEKPILEEQLAHLAKFDLVSTDYRIEDDVQKLKALNTNLIVVFYKNIIGMSPEMEDWDIVNAHEDWFLHDLNGNRLQVKGEYGWFLMDMTNEGWREHFASFLQTKLSSGFDGVFFDDCWTHLFKDAWTVPEEDVPNLNTGTPYTQWQTAMRDFISYVKTIVGNKLLIYNGGCPCLDIADGKMLEGFCLGTNPLDHVNQLASDSATQKIVMASPYGGVKDTHENFMFCYACYLLGIKGNKTYFSWINYYATNQGYYAEMDVETGRAIGAYYVEDGLYQRIFEHVKVSVDFANKAGNIIFEETSYPIEAGFSIIPLLLLLLLGVFLILTRGGD